jgi:uncharacterized RDD family membrane protein YckC
MAYPQSQTSISQSNRQAATKGQRIVAFGIDVLIVAIVSWLISWLPIPSYLIFVAYMLTRDAWPFLDGVSVGKKLMRIRAVSQDGTHLTGNWELSAKRNLVLLAYILGVIVEGVFLIVNEEDKRLGDQWFGTQVVQDNEL